MEPFNESTSNYWYNEGSQEGCHFSPSTQLKIIDILHDKLKNTNLDTYLAVSDETDLSSFIKVTNYFLENNPEIFKKIGQLNTHTYSGSDKERLKAYELTQQIGKPFWQSETGPSGNTGSGFKNNLNLAYKLFSDMKIMKPIAWLDWQLIEEHNDTWCQIRGDFKTQDYQITKNFYVRMQITKFFKQGYNIIEIENDKTLAAISEDKNELVISYLNNTDIDENIILNIPGYKLYRSYITSENKNCDNINIKSNKKPLDYTAPQNSITTFIYLINR